VKFIIKFSSVIFLIQILMQISETGYSASGYVYYNDSLQRNDSIYGNAKDSLINRGDSLLAIQENLKQGAGLYEKKCQKCHELYIPGDYTLRQWKENLDEMKDKAELTKGEYKLILGYLSANCKSK
jgi:hypothetical protein